MSKRDVAALSYADVRYWREYDALLPSAFRLSALDPEEERWSWRDISVHIDRLPAPDAPIKLIFVHGIGGYGRIVLGFGAPFHPELCEVVAPDNPCYGLTTLPRGRIELSTWTSMVSDLVEREVERDGRPVVVFGGSLGGMVAYHAACTAPLQGLIATALIDMTDPEVAVGVSRFASLSKFTMPLASRTPRWMGGLRLPARYLGKMHAISNDQRLSRLVARDPYGGRSNIPLSLLQSLMDTAPAIAPEEFDRCPVLLVHPAVDHMTDIRFSRRFFDRLATSDKEMVVLEGAGHWPIEEPGATQMNEAVRNFIKQVAHPAGTGDKSDA